MKQIFAALIVTIMAGCAGEGTDNYKSWPEYLGGPGRNHFSTLSQIDTGNVGELEISWIYESPDTGQMQMNPVMVRGVVYGVTAALKVFALDAETGKELWLYNDSAAANGTSRGVAYWEEGSDRRIFAAVGQSLVALNAHNGSLISSFGNDGRVDLHSGLPEEAQNKWITSTTPGTIYNNLIVMPVRVGENSGAAPGHIRAFDVISGELVWTFHTIPHPGEKGYNTWPAEAWKNRNVGAVNNWAGMALDKKSGILFIPLGSAAPDFYGGNRIGANLFANCLLALNAEDGSYRWHYQFVHHDLWDRDLPAPPNLISVKRKGRSIDAVAQVTKHGFVFVFDRETGEPLFPVDEVEVPGSLLEGEETWPSQPVPSLPKSFARHAYQLTSNDISPFAVNREELKKVLGQADKRFFAPPDTSTVLMLPGYDGGAEYGGAGADPQKGILYVNSNEMAWFLEMEPLDQPENYERVSPGEKMYMQLCSVCHGANKTGNALSGYPSLDSLLEKQSWEYVDQVIHKGKGKMPGFVNLTEQERKTLVAWLYGEQSDKIGGAGMIEVPQDRYRFLGYKKFLDSKGLPAISLPWGTLTAIDLNSGNHLWQSVLGSTPGLPDQENHPTGCENYGGPVITENGLIFIAGTKDGMFRAFSRNTGKLLWQTKLPAASFATPAMYSINGKQYIVLACGGEKLGTPRGNKIVAYSLQ